MLCMCLMLSFVEFFFLLPHSYLWTRFLVACCDVHQCDPQDPKKGKHAIKNQYDTMVSLWSCVERIFTVVVENSDDLLWE